MQNTIKSTPDTIIMLYSGDLLTRKAYPSSYIPKFTTNVISNQQSVPSQILLQGIKAILDADAVKILKEALLSSNRASHCRGSQKN